MDDFVNKAVIPVEAIDVDVQVHPNDKLEEARADSASNGHAILNSHELPLKTKTEPIPTPSHHKS